MKAYACNFFYLYFICFIFRFILNCGIHSRPYGSIINEKYQDNCIKETCIKNDCETTSKTTDDNMIVEL